MIKAAEIHYPRIPQEYWEQRIESKTISGFEYLPRAETNKPAMIKDFRIYLKTSPFKL